MKGVLNALREEAAAKYLAAMGTYAASCVALVAAGRIAGQRAPARVDAGDLALVTVATHKLSRLVSKESVTSPLRAPFTEYVEAEGEAEVCEEVRDHSGWHTFGELITCPFCLDQWIATGFVAGLVLAPRGTRLAASVLTAVAGADWLHVGYAAARQALR
jgi:hypothetical protein